MTHWQRNIELRLTALKHGVPGWTVVVVPAGGGQRLAALLRKAK